MKHLFKIISLIFVLTFFSVTIVSDNKIYGFDGKNIEIRVKFEKIRNDEYETHAVFEVKLQWLDQRSVFPAVLEKLANKYGVGIKKLTQISDNTFKVIVIARSRDDVSDLLRGLKDYFG